MERVVSVLGVATTKSALSFSSFETGLSTIAPVAAKFGFSIEDTTALLGQLANAGFDASSASTATRKILLNLADANGELAQELGRPIKSADDLAGALQELKEKGIDLGEALELTDVKSVSAFATFIEGSDSLVGFRDSITDVNQELKDMAEKKLDSVQGQLTLLGSAWDGFILSMSEASGTTSILKNSIGFLAKNLTQIMSVIGKVVRAFILYKVTMVALKVINLAVTGGFKDMGVQIMRNIPLTKQYAKAQAEAGVATKKSGVAVKGFGKAFASIGIFLIVSALTELAMAWYDIASGAREAREAEEKYQKAKDVRDKAVNQQKEIDQAFNEKRGKALKEEFRELEKQTRLENVNAKTKKQEQENELKLLKDKKNVVDRIHEEDKKQIKELMDLQSSAKKKADKLRRKAPIVDTSIFNMSRCYHG